MSDHDLDVARRVLRLEADGLSQLADSLDGRFSEAVAVLRGAEGRIICAGVGKSGHVARKIAATLASTGSPAQFVHPNEASHGDLGMIGRDDAVLMLSKSGQNNELSDVIAYTRRFDVPLIAITARPDSPLGTAADIVLELPDAEEACGATKAPTTSTTLMMAMGDCLAVALLERRGFTAHDFKVFHPGGKLGAMLRTVGDLMHGGDALPIISSGAALSDGLAVLSEKGFGCLGVLAADGALAGIITDGDVRRLVTSGQSAETVDDVMTRNPMVASPTELAGSVMARLTQLKRTQIFAVDPDGAPVGVVHMHDFLKAGLA